MGGQAEGKEEASAGRLPAPPLAKSGEGTRHALESSEHRVSSADDNKTHPWCERASGGEKDQGQSGEMCVRREARKREGETGERAGRRARGSVGCTRRRGDAKEREGRWIVPGAPSEGR